MIRWAPSLASHGRTLLTTMEPYCWLERLGVDSAAVCSVGVACCKQFQLVSSLSLLVANSILINYFVFLTPLVRFVKMFRISGEPCLYDSRFWELACVENIFLFARLMSMLFFAKLSVLPCIYTAGKCAQSRCRKCLYRLEQWKSGDPKLHQLCAGKFSIQKDFQICEEIFEGYKQQ